MRAAAILAFLFVTVSVAGQAPAPGPFVPGPAAPGAVPVSQPPGVARPQERGAAIIRGRVVRGDTGQPLSGARVRLQNGGGVNTDDEGRFELREVPAGRQMLVVSRTGFVARTQGLDIADGRLTDGIELALIAAAVIAGGLVDEFGEPLVRRPVMVLRQRYQDGERQLADVTTVDRYVGANGATDITDDLGQFRLFGLPPGTYYLAAGEPTRDGVVSARPTSSVGSLTFYPGRPSPAGAQPITVRAGDEVGGLSFPVVPVGRATIRGTALTSDGRSSGTLMLLAHDGIGRQGRRIPADRNGAFVIEDLAPGAYTLIAQDGNEVAKADVAVAEDADVFVSLALSRGLDLSGRIVFDAGAPPPGLDPSTFVIVARMADFAQGPGRSVTASNAWTFSTDGLLGPQRLTFVVPGGWRLKAVRRSGIEATDEPIDLGRNGARDIEVVLTQQMTTVSGVVAGDRRHALTDVRVVIFADDPARWGPGSRFVRSAPADESGGFTVRGLPPGRYVAVAVEGLEDGEWTNPEVLQWLSGLGARLTLGDGESRTVTPTVVAAP